MNSIKLPEGNTQKTNQIFFALFAVFLLAWMVFLFKSYLLTLSIGILMAVSTASIQNFFLNLTSGKRVISAIFSTIFLCTIFCVPFIYALIALIKHISDFDVASVNLAIQSIKNYSFKLPSALSFLEPDISNFIASLDLSSLVSKILSYVKATFSKSASFLIDMGFILVFYFFANVYGSELASYVKRVVPMSKGELEFIFLEVANTMSVVFYSTIANSILQGFLFALITYFYGYDGLMLGVLFAFSCLIPVVGGALMYVPLSFYAFSHGDITQAIVILLYCVIVISILADNFVKPLLIHIINDKLVKTPTKINELIIFFAMLAGLTSFGFWGIILGPAIITLTTATLKLYTLLKERDFV